MDFYYEQQTPLETPHEGTPPPKDDKTNQVFSRFENDLNSAYEKTAEGIKNIMNESNGSDGVQLDLPIDEATSEKAQALLTSLDQNLAKVETIASTYWGTINKSSFWSNISDNLGSQLDKVVKITADSLATDGESAESSQVDLNTNNHTIAGNRTEAELKELSINKKIYLDDKNKPEGNKIDIDSKTDEISEILKTNKDLESLMNALVPQEISYVDFWSIYFVKKDEILEREESRKRILTAGSKGKNSDNQKDKKDVQQEEIDWDDDEDEEEGINEIKEEPKIDSKKEDAGKESDLSARDDSLVIVNKSDVTEEKTTDTNNDNSKNGEVKDEEEEEEEEDDDWE
ncbi:hypothetical protein C6P45_005507 [Maudiozyma exigua]|uniref:BSD domain-containing protein n=1 Tax=Maudiozyma exigua TaxID=34358 RepID=A0A9P6WAS8_MAUEX|nr:hypothetical protein C6P45_005507 [Kazachstania exigua]